MPTIGEIAQELGKNKGTVRNWIKRLGLESHVSLSGDGRKTAIVDDYAASVLAAKLANKPLKSIDGEDGGGRADDALIAALNAHIADLQKQLEERAREAERREVEHRREIDAKDGEIADLRARLDVSLGAERRASETLQRVAGAGLWQRLTGFKGLLGDGSSG